MSVSRTTQLRLAAIACSAALLAGAAQAQERLPFRPGGDNGDLNGSRYIKPGALLFATFDSNQDLVITDEEIEAGARRAFAIADADGDGILTPLEQRSWAGKIGSENDVLANPTTFPAALPGQVTEDEFVAGLKLFSQRFVDPDAEIKEVLVRNFTFEPERGRRPERESDELERLRRPVISDRRNSNGL